MSWRSVVITGASGGIGAALAAELAAPGVTLLLLGRDAARLAAAAAGATARGAMVETAQVAVTDAPALRAALAAFDARHPVDLLVINAGTSSGLGPGRTPEPASVAHRVLAVNLGGAIDTVDALLPAMLARGRGQIALMGSMAALRPLPDMPAYSASKAALRAWGISLRGWLAPRGIAVTVICPGFVTSAMSARHRGFKPFEISAARAAAVIRQGLARRHAFVTFPWPLALLTWLDNRLPPRLSDWFVRGFAAEIAPDGE
jgi:short-subunit dehydrogenase